MIVTYDDILDHILDYAGNDAAASATSRHRRAIQNAYQLIPTRHDWSYLRGIGRVTTVAAYDTGTIEYDYTGGASERMVTLTGGTWPTWVASGYLLIADVPYKVETRVSNSIVTLAEQSAPTADIAALTEYQALQDQYALPADFIAGDEAVVNEVGTMMQYVHPREWSSHRRVNSGPGQPVFYTYLGTTSPRGRISIAIWPPSDAAYLIDILYKRSMRPLVYAQVSDGFVAATADSTTITGSNTAFKAGMVGSIIRFGPDGGESVPTGPTGNEPAVVERTITAVASGTSLTVDEAMPDSITAAHYLISDPIDIEVVSMYEYFCREVEKQWRLISRSKATAEEISVDNAAYNRAWLQAREADNRDQSRAAAWRGMARRSFSHMPIVWEA